MSNEKENKKVSRSCNNCKHLNIYNGRPCTYCMRNNIFIDFWEELKNVE